MTLVDFFTAIASLSGLLFFSGTTTLPFILVASVVLPLILLPTARRMGVRVTELETTAEAQPTT
jgi:hypothetical protein